MSVKKKIFKKVCEQCSKEFLVEKNRIEIARFCSRQCADKARAGKNFRKLNGETKVCKCCSKEFYVSSYRKDTAKFCSIECQNKLQYIGAVIKCENCGKDFPVSDSRRGRKFCSFECRHVTNIDEVAKRKLTSAYHAVNRADYKTTNRIRKHMLLLKNNTCDCCGLKEESCCMDIHHIDANPLNNSKDNLALLCVLCHRKLHANKLNDPRFPYIKASRKSTKFVYNNVEYKNAKDMGEKLGIGYRKALEIVSTLIEFEIV